METCFLFECHTDVYYLRLWKRNIHWQSGASQAGRSATLTQPSYYRPRCLGVTWRPLDHTMVTRTAWWAGFPECHWTRYAFPRQVSFSYSYLQEATQPEATAFPLHWTARIQTSGKGCLKQEHVHQLLLCILINILYLNFAHCALTYYIQNILQMDVYFVKSYIQLIVILYRIIGTTLLCH